MQEAQETVFEETEEGKLVVNMDDVDENKSTFKVIPRGIYDCVIDDFEYGESQNSGNPMWTYQLLVETGEHEGSRLYLHTVFTPEAMPRTKKNFMRVAPDLASGHIDPEAIAESGVMIGKKCRARVTIRKYQGSDRNNVQELLPPAEGADSGGQFV